MNDLLTAPGAAIKALERQTIGGHAVLFTNPWSTDRENDFFTKDTDYDLVDRLSIRSLWHHGLDQTVSEPLGRATFVLQDEGIFAKLKLKNDEVGKRVFKLAERGELAWSSGSSAHLVRREKVGSANWLSVWPVTELSVLPTIAAAEPRAKVQALKSLSDAIAQPLCSPVTAAETERRTFLRLLAESERRQFLRLAKRA